MLAHSKLESILVCQSKWSKSKIVDSFVYMHDNKIGHLVQSNYRWWMIKKLNNLWRLIAEEQELSWNQLIYKAILELSWEMKRKFEFSIDFHIPLTQILQIIG